MKTSKTTAFTLIELLVVISIIAILASIAIPAFSAAQLSAQQNKALQQTKGIFYGLKMFATDHNGSFPSKLDEDFAPDPTTAGPIITANDGFKNLLPTYLQSEKPFSVPSSRYCKSPAQGVKIPDDDFRSRQNVLVPGENTFAYVSGLNDTSNASYPIVADGFSAPGGTVGSPSYSATEGDYGAVWKGKKAIVVRCDGSVTLENINQQTFIVKRPGSGGNMFIPQTSDTDPWLVGCTVLDPPSY